MQGRHFPSDVIWSGGAVYLCGLILSYLFRRVYAIEREGNLMQRAEDQAYFVNALNGAYGGKVIPVPGGVLIKDSRDRIIGAVGVTGDTSDNDAAAALAGIEAAGLKGDA